MARRAHRAPVLLVSAAHDRLSRYLGHDSALDAAYPAPLHELALSPLDAGQTTQMLEDVLGSPAGEAFAAAVLGVTRGRPAVLRELADRFAERGLPPGPEQIPELVTLARAVTTERAARLVLGLPADALELLRVLAVCGSELGFEIAGSLVRLRSESLSGALAHLVVSGLVTGPDAPRLADPHLGAEVLAAMDPGARAELYLRAAALGHRTGAGAPAVADLLCAAPPVGRSWAAAVLTEASAQRFRQGRGGPAADALRRALAEPMEPGDRGAVLTRLAAIEVSSAPEASDGRLRQILTSPELRSLPSVVTAADLLLARGDAETTRQAASELCSPRTSGGTLSVQVLPRTAAAALSALGWLAQEEAAAEPELPVTPLPEPAAGPAQAGVLAWRLATRAEDRDRVRELARTALAARDDAPLMPRIAACRALLCCYDLDEASAGLSVLVADARRREARPVAAQALLYRAVAAVRGGHPEEAARDLAAAARELPPGSWHPSLVSRRVAGELTALVRLQRLDEAERLAAAPLPQGAEHGVGWAFLLYARAELRLATGVPESALSALRECGRMLWSRHWVNPMLAPWRTMAGIALRQLGEPDTAETLFAAELEIARRWGTGPVLETVREQAVADLGLRFPARPGRAAEPVRKPRRAQQRADGLSSAERDVAALAAQGLANREIAGQLSVALRTVELRLTKVYRKLGVKGRSGLAERWAEPGRQE